MTFIFLITILFFPSPNPVAGIEEPQTKEVIVLFDNRVDIKAVHKFDGLILEEYANLPLIKAKLPSSAINELKAVPSVKSVEFEETVKVVGQMQGWGIKSIKATQSWSLDSTGKGVKVAILDTGISVHEDLTIAGGRSFVEYTDSFHDDNGHGTHVAGIIGAADNNKGIVGVAPDSRLYAVKVLDKTGSGFVSNIIKGIDWAITNKMDIINLSLVSAGSSTALKAAIDKAANAGIFVVAAGGNDGRKEGTGDTVSYPAKYPTVIGVAAVDELNNRGEFSATGNGIELSAPGVNITSTIPNNEYASYDGTSMAAAFVSGKLALLKELFPFASNSWIRNKIKENTRDLGEKGKDPLYGYGLVQPILNAERIGGKDRFEVAINVSKKGWKTTETVFVTNYLAFADALSASPLAYKYNAPILLTNSEKLHTGTKSEIKRLQAKEVIIIGGKGSISDKVFSELKMMGVKIIRIGGQDRFEVAANIAEKMGAYKNAILTNGLNFPDALAIAPFAAANGYPILLTRSDVIPEVTKNELFGNHVEKTIVVGGKASVQPKVFTKLVSPERIGGKDRYEVAANIMNKYFPNQDHLYIATGSTFADALTGSIAIANSNSTILLTRKNELPELAAMSIAGDKVKRYSILGGEGSVGKGVFQYLVK
ncbi:cell wall-binding repeat-containing protein [Cytobacillus oceanisediminis]|uniref:Peptidase S8/S53 domain-containing protein n=1 Tax=Cytobacillus oceanisediminis 2691 TaxID=1196031 RepID=A0A160MG48_9BACI|nr:cell wall-binding repeat-containing protein [Cytobacillus oceanisediminis]AND42267.1 hypothetical protein A361_24990 [Cytobacillus oceanisediminis 2691]